MSTSCGCCGKKDAIYSCGKCDAISYCGPECQENSWHKHKIECKDSKAYIGLAFTAGALAAYLVLTAPSYGGYRWYNYHGYYYPRRWFRKRYYPRYRNMTSIPPNYRYYGRREEDLRKMSPQEIEAYANSEPPALEY